MPQEAVEPVAQLVDGPSVQHRGEPEGNQPDRWCCGRGGPGEPGGGRVLVTGQASSALARACQHRTLSPVNFDHAAPAAPGYPAPLTTNILCALQPFAGKSSR